MCVMNTAPENNPLRDLNNARSLPSGDLLPITAMQDEIQRRFEELCEEINALTFKSKLDAIYPSEVWLGPGNAFTYYAHMLTECMDGRRKVSEENTRRVIEGDVEGSQLCGLTVRLMKREGVRVGCTLGE